MLRNLVTHAGFGFRKAAPVAYQASSRATYRTSAYLQALAEQRLKIIYGSQTGTATMLSQQLGKIAKKKKWPVEVINMAKYDYEAIDKEKGAVVFVVSCFGQGEPTDNAKKMYHWLVDPARANEKAKFKSLNYAVFGLGSTEYAGHRYQRVGRDFWEKLNELEAKPLLERGIGDAAQDIEDDFDQWQKKLFEVLEKAHATPKVQEEVKATPLEVEKFRFYSANEPPPTTVTYYKQVSRDKYNYNNPLRAKIVLHNQLHTKLSNRSCHHIEFDISNTGVTYEAGQYLAVFPENHPTVVSDLVAHFGLDPTTKFSVVGDQIPLMLEKVPPWFPNPCTVGEALSRFCDLTSPPSRQFLRFLSEKATSDLERAELLRLSALPQTHRAELVEKTHFRTLPDLLREYPSVKLTFPEVMELTPTLRFRYYSISSSPVISPNRISLTVVRNAMTNPKTGAVKFGTASDYLDRLSVGDTVPIFVQDAAFKLPKDPNVPIVMVGAGTGLAPFRGFIQERRAQGAKANLLIFGCTNRDIDYLYRDEIEGWVKEGVINLSTAFSHEDPNNLVFVQHRLAENAEMVWDYINRGGYFYVCGSLMMGNGVEEALKKIVAETGGLGEQGATDYLAKMTEDLRIHWDLFA